MSFTMFTGPQKEFNKAIDEFYGVLPEITQSKGKKEYQIKIDIPRMHVFTNNTAIECLQSIDKGFTNVMNTVLKDRAVPLKTADQSDNSSIH